MLNLFVLISIISIASGGLLSAFSASKPSRFKIWASAYLVLITGLIQLGLMYGWLQIDSSMTALAILAFILYDLSSLSVIFGTYRKNQRQSFSHFVQIGGGVLAISMILLIISVLGQDISFTLLWFIALCIIILISAPIGLIMSTKRKLTSKS